MRTTQTVLAAIVAELATQYKGLSPESESYSTAIDKAAAIVTRKELTRNADGTWTVRDTAGSGKSWTVNGRCQCPASLKDMRLGHKEKGVCKHRIAVKMARQVEAFFQSMAAQQHTHRCPTCPAQETCWQEPCHDGTTLPECPTCAAGTLSADDILSQENQQEQDMLSQEELAHLAQPQYEVNPQTAPCAICLLPFDAIDHTPCTQFQPDAAPRPAVPVSPIPAPEAPASLNIKVKVGQYEVMYTVRSMQAGSAGDDELAARLPGIVAQLETLKGQLSAKGKHGQE